MNLFEKFQLGLFLQRFLSRYATDDQKEALWQVHAQIKRRHRSRETAGFVPQGDERPLSTAPGVATASISARPSAFRRRAPVIHLRLLDRDDQPMCSASSKLTAAIVFPSWSFSVKTAGSPRYGERP